jgi:tetratricopeptide (TPR) repeat protein
MSQPDRVPAFGEGAAGPVLPSPDAAKAQLDRILASRGFSRSKSLSRFLTHIVQLTLAGDPDRLKEYCIGIEVFARGESFDPKCDTIVRTQARKLRLRLDEYYKGSGAEDSLRIVVPKGGYIPVFTIVPQSAERERFWQRLRKCRWMPLVVATGLAFAWVAHVSLIQESGSHSFAGGSENVNSEARNLYLRARYCWNKGDPASLKNAINLFQRATISDGHYAEAWAGLSLAHGALGDDTLAKAEALHAVTVQPRSGKAHSALALALLRKDWDWRRAGYEARRAVDLAPDDPGAHHIYANVLLSLARPDEALAEIDLSQRLDPLSWRHRIRLAEILLYRREYARATARYREMLELEPRMRRAVLGLAKAYMLTGDYARASHCLEEVRTLADSAEYSWQAAYLRALAGERKPALDLLSVTERRTRTQPVLQLYVAAVYGVLGEKQNALAWLNGAFRSHVPNISEIRYDPVFDPLRSERDFTELLRKAHLDIGTGVSLTVNGDPLTPGILLRGLSEWYPLLRLEALYAPVMGRSAGSGLLSWRTDFSPAGSPNPPKRGCRSREPVNC